MTASPDVSTSPERHEPVVEPPPKRLITLETIAKSVTFLGLSMGFVGYLTINMFLSRFGFPDFSPINPRFVYVGALVLLSMALPVALLIMMVWVFWYGAKGYTRPTRPHTTVFHMVGDGTRWFWHHLYRRYFLAFWYLVILIAIVTAIVQISGAGQKVAGGLYLIILPLFIVTSAGSLLWPEVVEDPSAGDRPPFYRIGKTVQAFLILLVAFFAYLFVFNQYVYPSIPDSFGGGEPKQACILFARDDAAGMRELGIPIPDTKQLSEPVTVLYESGSIYVVKLKNGQVRRIDRTTTRGSGAELCGK